MASGEFDEQDLSEESDQLERPSSPRPRPSRPPSEAAGVLPPSSPSGPRPTRGKGRLLLVLVVIVALVVILAGSVYFLGLYPGASKPGTSTPPPPPPTCYGDKAGDWPTYLGEVTRNSQNCGETTLSSANAGQLSLLWSFNTSFLSPGYLQAEPVVADGTVYIGGGNGVFYAINATTGGLVWKSPNLGNETLCDYPDGITSSATVAGGEVYVGGGAGNFYALNQTTGQVDWQFFVGSPSLGYYNWGSPLVLPSLGYAYFGVSSNCDHPLVNGGLEQVSISTHQLVRFFSDLDPSQLATCNNSAPPPLNESSPGCGGSIWGSPSYDAATNTIWAATGNGYSLSVPEYGDSLMEWNASTLALISHWTIPMADEIYDGDFGTTPTLVNPATGPPMVFVSDKNGWSYAFDRASIAAGPVWQTLISTGHPVSPDAYGGGLLYVAGPPTGINGHRVLGAIRAFNPSVNATVWADPMPGEVYGAPVYANGLVVVAGGNLLEVLNSTTGQVLFSWDATNQVFLAAPAIADGVIYVGNSNGLVLAFGLPSGSGGSVTSGSTPGPLVHLGSPIGAITTQPISWMAVGVRVEFPAALTVPRS